MDSAFDSARRFETNKNNKQISGWQLVANNRKHKVVQIAVTVVMIDGSIVALRNGLAVVVF